MEHELTASHGNLHFATEAGSVWVGTCSTIDLELSIKLEDFLRCCRYRQNFTASGSMELNTVDKKNVEEIQTDLFALATRGYSLSLDSPLSDYYNEIVSVKFENIIVIPNPAHLDSEKIKNRSLDFVFFGCPEVLVWYK